MGFGPGRKTHWRAPRPATARTVVALTPCGCARDRYEDTQAAASKTEQRDKFKMWAGIGVFAFGLWAVQSSTARDKRAKERGELVDAWFNQTTRRWETPRAAMYKDPLLSSLIHLKPPSKVYKATAPGQGGQAAPRAKPRTFDGQQPTVGFGRTENPPYRVRKESQGS